ncbi:hypothetical protein [Salana multivorans]
MGAYSARELQQLARWICTDGVVRDVPRLAADLARELGLPWEAAGRGGPLRGGRAGADRR